MVARNFSWSSVNGVEFSVMEGSGSTQRRDQLPGSTQRERVGDKAGGESREQPRSTRRVAVSQRATPESLGKCP